MKVTTYKYSPSIILIKNWHQFTLQKNLSEKKNIRSNQIKDHKVTETVVACDCKHDACEFDSSSGKFLFPRSDNKMNLGVEFHHSIRNASIFRQKLRKGGTRFPLYTLQDTA